MGIDVAVRRNIVIDGAVLDLDQGSFRYPDDPLRAREINRLRQHTDAITHLVLACKPFLDSEAPLQRTRRFSLYFNQIIPGTTDSGLNLHTDANYVGHRRIPSNLSLVHYAIDTGVTGGELIIQDKAALTKLTPQTRQSIFLKGVPHFVTQTKLPKDGNRTCIVLVFDEPDKTDPTKTTPLTACTLSDKPV